MPNKPDPVKSLLNKLHCLEDAILALVLFGMMFLAISQIVLRNFFDSGLIWADPLLRVMVLWIGLLGALAATRENRHISIDILTRYLSGVLRQLVRVLINLFSFSVTLLLTYHSWRFVLMEYDSGSVAFATVPTWILELILPVGFALISLRFGIHLVFTLRVLIMQRESNHG